MTNGDNDNKMKSLNANTQLPVDRMEKSICQPNSMKKCFRINSSSSHWYMTLQFTKLFDDYCPTGDNQQSLQAGVMAFTPRMRRPRDVDGTDGEMPTVWKGCEGSLMRGVRKGTDSDTQGRRKASWGPRPPRLPRGDTARYKNRHRPF